MTTSARLDSVAQSVRSGNRRSLARAARWVDDRREGYEELLKRIYPHTGNALILGVTGNPGAGKSTLVDRLIQHHRAAGRTVAVVAVDPTSPFTGGAILGDRIRMQDHFLDEGVFIRSLATRGALGGLSHSASGVVHLMDAAGFDVVLVETVGVGQDELEIAKRADTTIVVMAPGMGDDVQAIKAGILEVADIFAVNKADRDGAESTVRDLSQMVMLGESLARAAARSPGDSAHGHAAHTAHGHSAAAPKAGSGADGDMWSPPIMKTIATRDEGVSELLEKVADHTRFLRETKAGQRRIGLRRRRELEAIFFDALQAQALQALGEAFEQASSDVEHQRVDPYTACEGLLAQLSLQDT